VKSHKHARAKLDKMIDVLRGGTRLLIVMQNYPDPDALASAAAVREIARAKLDLETCLTSSGMVGRAENRALLKYLRVPFRRLDTVELDKYDRVAMVDTQPRTGNNDLPAHINPHVVIDHHPLSPASRKVPFTDIRGDYGSCSTILYEYLRAADIEIETPIATALLYGIKSDTQDLGREASRADVRAFLELYPVCNPRMLSQIQNSKTPRSYFRMLSTALQNARVVGEAIVASMGAIDTPDIIGEMADLMLRDEESDCTLVYGFYEGRILMSLRAERPELDAGLLMRQVVAGLGTGGGHRTMAGGQIPLGDADAAGRAKIEAELVQRYLRLTGDLGRDQNMLAAATPPRKTIEAGKK
jgi:nanoRNase/pAp phosphatase (c-di-AMP/oligoRNAs hydrolase)